MQWHLEHSFETSAGKVACGKTGSGPPLVLAHGWPWSSFSWHSIIPELAEHFCVHWYDMPGYGRSDKAANQPTSLDVQGEIFCQMLKHWNLDSPRVVAHDFGGATTLRAHLLHGQEFEQYLLMNVVAMRPWGSEFFTHVSNHVAAFQGLPTHIHEAIVRAYINGALICEIDHNDINHLVSPWLDEKGKQSFYKQFAQADEKYTAEIEADFGNVRCPVKIAWGSADPWIPLERGMQLHACIPQAEFALMPGLGHLPQLESPKLVAHEIMQFMV